MIATRVIGLNLNEGGERIGFISRFSMQHQQHGGVRMYKNCEMGKRLILIELILK